jgi:hypothetical protein
LSVVDPRVIGLGLTGFPGTSSPPISWRHVEGSVEQACSWVAIVDRLLREAMAVVGRDILHPIRVS